MATGVYYNTAAVIDADGTYLGKYRKNHIPHCAPGFWEKFYFKPGNLGYPVFKTQYADVGVYICYDRHFPEGARELGLERRGDRVQSVGDGGGAVGVSLEARAAGARGGERVTSSARSIASATRSRGTSASSTGRATSAIRAGSSSRRRSRDKDELITAELDLDQIREVRNIVAVLSRPAAGDVRGALQAVELQRKTTCRELSAEQLMAAAASAT